MWTLLTWSFLLHAVTLTPFTVVIHMPYDRIITTLAYGIDNGSLKRNCSWCVIQSPGLGPYKFFNCLDLLLLPEV